MATFGKTDAGASPIDVYKDVCVATKFSIPENGDVTQLSVYLAADDSNGDGNRSITIGIWDDNAGTPNNLLATATGDFEYLTATPAWYNVIVSVSLTAGTYWLGHKTNLRRRKCYYDAGTSGQTKINNNGIEDPFGTPDSSEDNAYSIYATYTPSGAPSGQPYVSRVQQVAGMNSWSRQAKPFKNRLPIPVIRRF